MIDSEHKRSTFLTAAIIIGGLIAVLTIGYVVIDFITRQNMTELTLAAVALAIVGLTMYWILAIKAR